jgi:DNA-binding XRE family transcriptional regulator
MRPTKYSIEYNEQVEKLAKLGATDAEIADFLDVTETTINNWKIEYPKFFESIKRGKIIADSNVADRLYQRAMGFEHDSEEIKVVSIGGNAGSSVERVPIRKIYPPDPTAAIFWLKNRRPKEWRDKQEIEHTGEAIKSLLFEPASNKDK